jgi:hypothetical protein
MAKKKAPEAKAVRKIEKAVVKAMRKGVSDDVVEQAVERAIEKGTDGKKAQVDKVPKGLKASKPAKKKSTTAE